MSQPPKDPAATAPKVVHHELRTAANSAAYLLAALPSITATTPHPTLLDVGAGSGTISTGLAQALPEGQITAVDLSAAILPRARAIAAAAGVTNITFQQADVHSLPFADGTFDVVHCHQMLAHLKEPWEALREMVRVTKAGGIVAAREGDFETECFWPALPGLVKFHGFIAEFLRMAGGTPVAGRQLLAWALRAGVERGRVSLSYGTWCYSTPEEKRIWAQGMVDSLQSERMRNAGLLSGLVTESDLDEMKKAWEEWPEKEDANLGMMSGEILIQK